MSLSRELAKRADSKCELCCSDENLDAYIVPPKSSDELRYSIAICGICNEEMGKYQDLNANHWRCLNDSMWSQEPAVQVVAYRLLHELKNSTDWASDLLDMMYMDEETKAWADSGLVSKEDLMVHKDSNGNVLNSGDTVVLIQDLNVKGASLTAKRGTAVRRIRLDPNNVEYIEGKVEGQHIVILTKYVKKS